MLAVAGWMFQGESALAVDGDDARQRTGQKGLCTQVLSAPEDADGQNGQDRRPHHTLCPARPEQGLAKAASLPVDPCRAACLVKCLHYVPLQLARDPPHYDDTVSSVVALQTALLPECLTSVG